jgi:hypothetical protein
MSASPPRGNAARENYSASHLWGSIINTVQRRRESVKKIKILKIMLLVQLQN